MTTYTRMEISELPVELTRMIRMSLGDVSMLDVEVVGKIWSPIMFVGKDDYLFNKMYNLGLTDLNESALVTLSFYQPDLVNFLLDKLGGIKSPKNLKKVFEKAYDSELLLLVKGNYSDSMLSVHDVELIGKKGDISLVDNLEATLSLAMNGKLSLK